jgi:membrane fusion protein (multidrug efflux system)
LVAVRHVIGAGMRKDGWVEVTSGLEPGQRIIADGSNRVRPNDPVQVVAFSGDSPGQGAGRPGGQGVGGQGAGGRAGTGRRPSAV